MRSYLAIALGAVLLLPAGASASKPLPRLLRDASRLSGLPVQRPVRLQVVTAAPKAHDYPSAAASLYRAFGLGASSATPPPVRARYNVATRRLLVQRRPAAGRRTMIHEYVRALLDENYKLKRAGGLLAKDRDRALAANAIVDGTAALSSHLRAPALHGTPLDRFTALESGAGLGPGRALAARLRYLGGTKALVTALRRFPQTTEQLLHIDKFLMRERALPVALPPTAGGKQLAGSQTFGELDVRSLLQAFSVPGAATVADGWGGGRFALYGDVAVVVLRWDTADDAVQWQAAVPRYVAAAFPTASAQTCPPLDRCWSSETAEVAAGIYGTTAVLASGPGAAAVAAELL
jgi:hypothetical protein